MKKHVWIIAALAALALVFTACGGSPVDTSSSSKTEEAATGLYLADIEGGSALPGNTITTTETNQNLYVYFDPPGKNFDKLVFDFTVSPGANLTVTALYGRHEGELCTWGKLTWDTDFYESGPLDIFSTDFTEDWSNTGTNGITKATIRGFCVNVAASGITFTVTKVTFAGLTDAADKTALNELIEEAEALVEGNYTPETWGPFTVALAAAKLIANKTNATEAEINVAGLALAEAMEGLVLAVSVDKDALNALITQAKLLNEADYAGGGLIKVSFKETERDAVVEGSSMGWSEFAEALDGAETVAKKDNAPQEEVDAAVEALEEAMENLAIGVTVSENTITKKWDPTDGSGAFRIKVALEEGFDISSGYSKFVMNWSSGATSKNSFNISLFFPDNRMLSKDVNSGVAEFDFTADNPSWAQVWGDAAVGTITGFEIYSADEFESDDLVITAISFEGADEGGGVDELNWYLSDAENGTAAPDNSVTGSGTGEDAWYVYIYFDPQPAGIKTISLDFETTEEITLIKQCVYDDTGSWGWGWGDVNPGDFDLSGSNSWSGASGSLNLTTLKGICIKVEGDGTFTLNDVVITVNE